MVEALPIDAVVPDLLRCLERGHALLCAPTGSGKTTRVPLALLDAPWLQGRSILMLEPRRPAARLAAAHMAAVLGEAVGETVGHQVRFERRIGPSTRVQVLTEGILTRRIQGDPELSDCGLLIFDEFHERGLQADLGLALALDLASLRPDLRILVMSATLDSEPLVRLLNDAPIIRGSGRAHPVKMHFLDRQVTDPLAAVVPAVRSALAEHAGDLLVFLPGAGEIQRLTEQLRQSLDAAPTAASAHRTRSPERAPLDGSMGIEILPMHGSLSLAEQERALRPGSNGRRRVLLATDIAETSLTIEGIEVVIDTGLTRKPHFAPGVGLTRLLTQPISQASAEQRAGRAGRTGPGHCYRLWTQAQHLSRPKQRDAEILEADLAPLVLELALWGVSDPSQLRWLDPPPAAAWAQAQERLQALSVLDRYGAITAIGRRVASIPAHPRLGRMLIGAPVDARVRACELAALLEERDPWRHQPGHWRPVDLLPRLAALERLRRGQATPDFDPARLRAVKRAAGQFQRLLARASAPESKPRLGPKIEARRRGPPATLGALLALAYPERVARRREGRGGNRGGARYLLRNGTGAELPRNDALAAEPWLVIADLEAAQGDHRIRAAAAISEAEVRERFAEQILSARVLSWDDQREALIARTEVRFGAILLDAQPVPLGAPEEGLPLLLSAIARDPERALRWSPAGRQLSARVALARRLQPEADWPDLSPAALSASLQAAVTAGSSAEHWLSPWLAGMSSLAEVRRLDLAEVMLQHLGWARAQALDALAPSRLRTPAETDRPIDYTVAAQPVLQVPLQELFGVSETPCIFEGRQPLRLHLLSPAGRPLQVTQDLAAFWSGAYTEVRKEMRGRYPKHHWPEDPAREPALKGGLKRHAR